MDLSLAGKEMVTQAAGWSPPHSDIPTSDLLSGRTERFLSQRAMLHRDQPMGYPTLK